MHYNLLSGKIIKTEHYCRNENGGIVTLNLPETGTKILNPSGGLIYRAISSGFSYEKILSILLEKYSNVSADLVEKDFKSFLFSLKNLGYIFWEEKEHQLVNGCRIAGEQDYYIVHEYIKSFMDASGGINGFIRAETMRLYSIPALRTKSFSLNEVYFISVKHNKMSALISIGGLDIPIGTAVLSFALFDDFDRIVELFDKVRTTLKLKNIRKIKLLVEDSKLKDKIVDISEDLGFKYECTLREEVNGKDVQLFSYFT